MQLKTARDFDQELLILFDAYVHGTLGAAGGMTAGMLLTTVGTRTLKTSPAAWR